MVSGGFDIGVVSGVVVVIPDIPRLPALETCVLAAAVWSSLQPQKGLLQPTSIPDQLNRARQ